MTGTRRRFTQINQEFTQPFHGQGAHRHRWHLFLSASSARYAWWRTCGNSCGSRTRDGYTHRRATGRRTVVGQPSGLVELVGYEPARLSHRRIASNVEWTNWSSDSAIKIAWRNWGRQLRVLPPPNLMSPRYREACHEEMRVIDSHRARLVARVAGEPEGIVDWHQGGLGIIHRRQRLVLSGRQ